jgi:hypothetical protein
VQRWQRHEVVGPDEDVELTRVQASDARVVDGEVEHCEEVAGALVLGVDVDLRALAPREHVLDVEGVPAELGRELLNLLVARGLEVDPGQPVLVELSEPGLPRRNLGTHGLPDAARSDAGQARHRY